jgi:ubiquinone/menaquinone biosynthesis C-methylase UbiE
MADERRVDPHTWSDVDRAEDPRAFTSYLDTIRTVDAAAVYKRRSIEMMRLGPGMSALDLGCGTGDDAHRIAEVVGPSGRVLGVDVSEAMIEESRRRWSQAGSLLEFRVGDAHALALGDAGLDAARADRVFQHLAAPVEALRELVRVTRPGGRVVVSDPDWGTYVVDAPRTSAVERYHRFAQAQARNPWMGRQLYGLFRQLGLVELELEAHVAVVLDHAVLERLGNLDAGFIAAVAAGQLGEAEVSDIKAELRARHEAGRFFASVNIVTVAGSVPR